MTKISTDSTLVIADDVVSCDLDGETAILNVKEGVYYGLDPIGAKIWNLIQKPKLLGDVIEIIYNEYDVERDRCMNDIIELMEELLNNGLVKINE
jgi:hypothetical protein